MTEPEKRKLGRTGWSVSELGFGAWPIGGTFYGAVREDESIATVEAYLDAGGNFIDTARRYGRSEEFIGKALKGKGVIRDQVFICSKTQKSSSIESIPEIRTELEESLLLLRTDYIDLHYLHWPPDDFEVMNRVLDEFETLKNEGKIRSIGASIKGPSVTRATVDLCKQYIDSGRVDVLQVVYSILRQKNAEIFEYAKEKGVGIVARTVLESGFLSGKYKPGHLFSEGHRSKYDEEALRKILAITGLLESSMVREPFTSIVQTAIRFALEPDAVSSVIAGARTPEQMRSNMAVAGLPPLDKDILEQLNKDFSGMTETFNPMVTVPDSMKAAKRD